MLGRVPVRVPTRVAAATVGEELPGFVMNASSSPYSVGVRWIASSPHPDELTEIDLELGRSGRSGASIPSARRRTARIRARSSGMPKGLVT